MSHLAPRTLLKWYEKHDLSINSIAIGVTLVTIGGVFTEGEGMWWDIWSGAGLAFLIPGVWYLMAGKFREVNKPEDPPPN